MPRNPKSGGIPGKRSSRVTPQGQAAGAAANISNALAAATQAFQGGDRARADAILQQALTRHPGQPELLHLGGYFALSVGDAEQGIELIRRAIKAAPKVALYHYNLGNAYSMRKQLDQARDAFQQAVRCDPQMKAAVENLALVQVRQRRLREAEALFERAVKLDAQDPRAWLNLAKVRMEMRKAEAADAAIRRAAALGSSVDAAFWSEAGQIYQGLGDLQKAEEAVRKGLEIAPGEPRLMYLLGTILGAAEAYEEAETLLREVCDIDPNAHLARVKLADLYIKSGQVDKGREQLSAVVAGDVKQLNVLENAAKCLALIGEFDLQEQVLLRILEREPRHLDARLQLASIPSRQLHESDVKLLQHAIDQPEADATQRRHMGFALGRHFHNVGQYDKAFAYFRQGNQSRGYRWDRDRYRDWVNQTCAIYTPDFFAERAAWGSDSRMPILIVGMLRSGTTLTEQILSAHSDVHGAGEFGSVSGLASSKDLLAPDVLRDAASILGMDAQACAAMAQNYLQRITAQTRHGEHFVTNKLPTNFQRVGLFSLLFPQAPVIHVRRDPRDNLLSIYFEDFAGHHPYAYDLKNLAFNYWEQERLMAHWKSVVPNPVFDLQYEDLVADLPGMIERLAAFVGIEVEPAMLRFYEQKREIRTASQWQVRQKLYDTSVGRWKPYQRQLKPLFDALQEFAPQD